MGININLVGYQKIRTLSYKNADIFLVCFALNSAESFDNVKARWAKEVCKQKHFFFTINFAF